MAYFHEDDPQLELWFKCGTLALIFFFLGWVCWEAARPDVTHDYGVRQCSVNPCQ